MSFGEAHASAATSFNDARGVKVRDAEEETEQAEDCEDFEDFRRFCDLVDEMGEVRPRLCRLTQLALKPMVASCCDMDGPRIDRAAFPPCSVAAAMMLRPPFSKFFVIIRNREDTKLE